MRQPDERDAAEAAFRAWVDHYEGPLPYLEGISLMRHQAHCVNELVRTAFVAGWEAAKRERLG